MMRRHKPTPEDEFFSLPMASWVMRVLEMLVAAVGNESVLGLILRQTRSEIASIVRDEQGTATALGDQWFKNN
jgi:hypothetical protein